LEDKVDERHIRVDIVALVIGHPFASEQRNGAFATQTVD
jgi:hypothetical protein